MPEYRMSFTEYAENYLPPPVRKRYYKNLKNILGWVSIERRYTVYNVGSYATLPFNLAHSPEGYAYWHYVGAKFQTKLTRR